MSRMSRTSIAKARRTLALPPEIVRMAEIVAEIAAAAEGVREVADVDAGVVDVMAAVVVDGMAAAGTAGEDTNLPAHQIRFRGSTRISRIQKRAVTSVAA